MSDADGTPSTGRKALRYEDRCRLQREKLEAAALELLDVCSRVSGVTAIYAYGSFARGTVGPTSNFDVLIIRETTLPRSQREDNIRVALRAPVAFDMLVVRPDEFESVMPNNSVGRGILRDARLLGSIEHGQVVYAA